MRKNSHSIKDKELYPGKSANQNKNVVQEKPIREHTSPHILAASASLLGLCFLVLTSIRLLELSRSTYIDEFSSFALILFMGSSVFSFWSMRSLRHKHQLDTIAAYLFFSGLLLLCVITVVVTLRNL